MSKGVCRGVAKLIRAACCGQRNVGIPATTGNVVDLPAPAHGAGMAVRTRGRRALQRTPHRLDGVVDVQPAWIVAPSLNGVVIDHLAKAQADDRERPGEGKLPCRFLGQVGRELRRVCDIRARLPGFAHRPVGWIPFEQRQRAAENHPFHACRHGRL